VVRVAVHDYAGHPFQAELSRELARRGHDVLHLYSSAITTPRGALQRTLDDPVTFDVEPVDLKAKIDRDRLFERRRLEAEHGRRVVKRLRAFAPEVVLSSNAPLEAQKRISSFCESDGISFVYWVQDLIREAAKRLLRERSVIARPVASYYARLERRLLRASDGVIVISEDFRPYVPPSAVVIENWAPLRELPVRPKDNTWSRRHRLQATTNLLYSGTLGMKHDPGLLVRLAQACAGDESIRMVVATEGSAADWLREQREQLRLANLIVLPFQPYEELAEMHAAADVLIALLEPDAGVFSVPSKVLSYLCAARPLLLIVPPENLAARIVREHGAGMVVSPSNRAEIDQALASLIASPSERAAMGARARAYAEGAFDLSAIADRFEDVFHDSGNGDRGSPRRSRPQPFRSASR
jgi:colanic acid biosynthesis glycosyl transferase WcaI